jgi:very-short-patch-repair endonuclease/predicted nucleic acid-binding Zn ribbon protein
MAKNIYTRNCLYCQNEFIASDKYKKYCNLSCSGKHRGFVAQVQNKNIESYDLSPKICPQCCEPIVYSKRDNKFCSYSCGAKYNNKRKDWSKIKTGPKPSGLPRKKWFTKQSKNCAVCNQSFIGLRKSCSESCLKILSSKLIRERIYNGWDPNSNRGRHKKSYLEQSFSEWLDNNYPKLDYITEQPFKRLDMIKTYYADFYFPNLNLIIELDGSQHKHTQQYDSNRDDYITKTYDVNIVRISHQEYQSKSKIDLIKNLLG